MNNTGKDLFEKDHLKMIVSCSKNWLDPDNIFINPKSKYGLMILNTRLGQKIIGKEPSKAIQKDIKLLPVNLDTDFYGFIDIIYDLIHKAYNSSIQINEYVSNEHVAESFFEAFEYIYFESIFDMTKSRDKILTFKEHLINEESFKNEDINALYTLLKESYNPIRNNIILFDIDYPQYSKYEYLIRTLR